MNKQDTLNKLAALSTVVDRLPEDTQVIGVDFSFLDMPKINLAKPLDEGNIMEALGLQEISHEDFTATCVAHSMICCGVKVFWLVSKDVGRAKEV